jgi:hypothetical protein
MSIGQGPSASREHRESQVPQAPRDQREPRDLDDEEAEDLRHAIRESRREKRPPRPTQTPGAGSSRDHSRSARSQASSAPRRGAITTATGVTTTPPQPPTSIPDATPHHHDYEVATIRKGGHELTDPAKTKHHGFACIPLPEGWTSPYKGLVIVRGPATPPAPEDAMSYLELWAGLATGRTVPDPFRRLFDAIGTAYHHAHAREAMLGYGLVRRISNLHRGTLSRDAINAFLVTLAAFDRALGLTTGSHSMWSLLLTHEPEHPTDNWGEVRGFMNSDTYPREDFGLSFLPPADPSQPWEIRTLWRRDDFMQVLLAIRPTLQSLRRLIAYADIFIRTRPADLPLPGIPLPNEPHERMYTASFLSGSQNPESFIVDTTSATGEPSAEMEVDAQPAILPGGDPAPAASP